jgi:hypothetical protein
MLTWLSGRERTGAEQKLLSRLVHSQRRWGDGLSAQHRARAMAWYEAIGASLGSLPSERQTAVMAWASVAAWTEAHESDGRTVWCLLAEDGERVARSIDDTAAVAREADALATVARLMLDGDALAPGQSLSICGGLLALNGPLADADLAVLDAPRAPT